MEVAEQECSGYVLSLASGMLGLRLGLGGARAEAHGTVGYLWGWMAPRAEAQATVGGIVLSRAGRDDDYSNTTRNPSVL